MFGDWERPYVDDYKPVPFSHCYVRHIAGWYAQKHPDEDFSETFAVWLTPGSDWRRRYRRWPALRKLEYVDRLVRELAGRDPPHPLVEAVAELPAHEMRATVAEFYEQQVRDEQRELQAVALDRDLEDIFAPASSGGPPASALIAEHRRPLVDRITYWTGVRRSLVKALIESTMRKSRELELTVAPGGEQRALVELTAYCTALVMNYLSRGAFTEE